MHRAFNKSPSSAITVHGDLFQAYLKNAVSALNCVRVLENVPILVKNKL